MRQIRVEVPGHQSRVSPREIFFRRKINPNYLIGEKRFLFEGLEVPAYGGLHGLMDEN